MVSFNAQQSFFLADDPLLDHIHSDPNRGKASPLTTPSLKHPELIVFHREFDILHVLVVCLEDLAYLLKLSVGPGHHCFQLRDRPRRPDAGNDIPSLSIDENLTEEELFPSRWIPLKTHPSAHFSPRFPNTM